MRPVRVVAAVIRDAQRQILLTRRPEHVHQGGLWEFPGGKREAHETAFQALCRELQEEVDIQVAHARPLIKINHDYGDKQVELDVWEVEQFEGKAWGREGQAWTWVSEADLDAYAFPAANVPIIKAARLPAWYGVLEGDSVAQVLQRYQQFLTRGVGMVQLRLKNLAPAQRRLLIEQLLQTDQAGMCWILNSDRQSEGDFSVQGLHLTTQALMALSHRPTFPGWIGASCHDLAQLQHAERLGLDFAVLSPVQATTTHPQAQPLGWQAAATLIEAVNLPVYLMGGLAMADWERARLLGAQGIAGITSFLDR